MTATVQSARPSAAYPLRTRHAVGVFAVLALGYFFSTLLRAITATLSPVLVDEMALQARDLGLLSAGYFLGFSLTQLPLGRWLDRHGPKRMVLAFMSLAVVGCLAFSQSQGLMGLLLSRILCGMGVSACLMAPLTGYRRWFAPHTQLQANAWMLMVGSFGMVAATLPVQWLLPLVGWRTLFVGLAGLALCTMWAVARWVPEWHAHSAAAPRPADDDGGYGAVWRQAYFWRMAPIGFFSYGGMVAIQTLWAGPWLTQVVGWSAWDAAAGLFGINVAMLVAFWLWGMAMPRLQARGVSVNALVLWAVPASLGVLGVGVWWGPSLGGAAALWLALFCVLSSAASLAQPAVGLRFPAHLAGRALSAFNLVIFTGVFVMQWGLGWLISAALAWGWTAPQAHQWAFAVFGGLSAGAWLFFACFRKDNEMLV